MRAQIGLILLLFSALPLLAKPKVNVQIKMDDEIERDRPKEGLSRGGGSSIPTTIYGSVFFMNVTVLSDNAEAVARNNGQWCISGEVQLDTHTEYHGTLDGNNLEIEIPQKNGKIKKQNFDIIDHTWRKLNDIARLSDLPWGLVQLYG